MAFVFFKYEGTDIPIQCAKEDKMRNICNKYISKMKYDPNSLQFLYNGNQINYELTFYGQANRIDKQRLQMNVLVIKIDDSNEFKCPKCGHNLSNIKIINEIIKCNNNINNMLNELKNQIEYINDMNQIDNKKRIINFIINDITKENEKIKGEIKSINQLNEHQNDKYNNFDIKLKQPIQIIKAHEYAVQCATVLNDGRFATCSNDKSILIYNNKTFKPELIIREHTDDINCILQLSNGMLASCSNDRTIKIFNIQNNNYQIVQILNNHSLGICKIIELNNKKLVSCSYDSSIIIWSNNNNNQYLKENQINTGDPVWCVIQTKENEICYFICGGLICFYDLIQKNITYKKGNISSGYFFNFMNMITKDLLIITGNMEITIIDVNKYNTVRTIDVPDSSYIISSCLLNGYSILTGDSNGKIKQWKIEGDNLKLISTKEKAHDQGIFTFIKLGDGHILSGSADGFIKIW